MAFRDIRKKRKWLSGEEIRLLGLGAVLLAALLAGNIALARVLPGGEWFFLRWSSAQAFLTGQLQSSGGVVGARLMPEAVLVGLSRGAGPYSTEIAQLTQEMVYGRRAFVSEYNYVLTDPLFILLLYLPFAFIQDFALARAIWMLLCEITLVWIVLLSFNLSEWQPRRWVYVTLVLFGVLQYFSLNALVTATPAILLTLLYLGVLLALRAYSDELAGALLALVAYQWEVGGLFFLFVIFFALMNRRWGVLAGLGMALFVLLGVSFLADSTWGLPYLRAVLSGWFRGSNFTLGFMASNWFPDLRLPIGTIVSFILAVALFIEWFDSIHAPFRRVVWTASLSLAAAPLMGLPIFPSNHVVLILPFILILALVWERWQRYRTLRFLLLVIPVLAIPYVLYARVISTYDPLVLDLIAVLPALAAIIGLYWMRWWVLRAPLTWFDRVGGRV